MTKRTSGSGQPRIFAIFAVLTMLACDVSTEGERLELAEQESGFRTDDDVEVDLAAPLTLTGESGENLNEPDVEPDQPTLVGDNGAAGGCSNVCNGFNAFGPVGCVYARESTTTADEIDVECPGTSPTPISGGCYTNDAGARLQISHPNEGSLANLPENGDGVSVGDGWSCDWTKSPDAGETHIGLALCCDIVRLTQCSC